MYTAILFESHRGFINLHFPVDSFAITAQKCLRAKNTVLGGTAKKKGGLGSWGVSPFIVTQPDDWCKSNTMQKISCHKKPEKFSGGDQPYLFIPAWMSDGFSRIEVMMARV
jgi:hypothetical protein